MVKAKASQSQPQARSFIMNSHRIKAETRKTMEPSDKQKELTSRYVVKLETPENGVAGFLLYKPVAPTFA